MATAKIAHYKGDKLQMLAAAKAAAEAKYKLGVVDETTLSIRTMGRWHTPDGLASNWDPGDMSGGAGVPSITAGARMADRSFWITLTVKLLPEGDSWIVHVEPTYLQYRRGQPNLLKLKTDDPEIPGWAQGKVDQLAFEIHEALKPFEVQTLPAAPGAAPPAPAPAPAPAAAPGDPATGSGSAS